MILLPSLLLATARAEAEAEAGPYYGHLGYSYGGGLYPGLGYQHYQQPYVYPPSYPPTYGYLPSLHTARPQVTYNYHSTPAAPSLPSSPVGGIGPAYGGFPEGGLDPAVARVGPPVGGAGPSIAGVGPTVRGVGTVVEGAVPAIGRSVPGVRGVTGSVPPVSRAVPAVGGSAHSVAAVADVSHLEASQVVRASQYHAQDEEGNYSFGYQNPSSARVETGSPHTGVRG